MAGENNRRVLDYSELWSEASTSAATPNVQNGSSNNGKKQQQKEAVSIHSKPNAWSEDGTPQTASSSRKLRKILTTISTGQIEAAEKELSTMGTAKNNFDIQRALVIAKKKRAEGGGIEDFDDGDDEYGYEENRDGEGDQDTDMIGTTFDWQGTINGNGNGKEAGRQLTHAEIWDDSALVDAWNAAQEEYKIFHARRSAQESESEQNGSTEDKAGHPSKRNKSALWHESPAKESAAAIAAKVANLEHEKMKKELEDRKKQARALLAQVAGDDQEEQMPVQQQEILSNAVNDEQRPRKKLKGTTPPSSSISGNLAWHSACATVSQTPNAIGQSMQEVSSSVENSSTSTSRVEPASDQSTSIASEGEEIFQNLAMAWYYAGYYQAMAISWSAGRGGASE